MTVWGARGDARTCVEDAGDAERGDASVRSSVAELAASGYPPRFEPLRTLGAGSFGSVVLARDRVRGGEVAVKELVRVSAGALLGFKQEFRALAGLSHPNLVTLYELIAEGPRWLLAMEYVAGCRCWRTCAARAGPVARRRRPSGRRGGSASDRRRGWFAVWSADIASSRDVGARGDAARRVGSGPGPQT